MTAVTVRITDEKGEFTDFVRYEDLVVPKMLTEKGFVNVLDSVKNMEHREGDVFIVSYPKTGTHWINNLTHYIRSSGPVDDVPSIAPILVEMPMMPGAPKLPQISEQRLLTSHLKHDRLPRDFIAKDGKFVFVLRNPKDTAVSMFHMLKKVPHIESQLSWDCFVTCFISGLVPMGSYFDYLDDWQDVIQENPDKFCVVYYEDMKKDGISELKRIQEFLGCNNDDERLQHIISKCSLGSLKADVETGKVKSPLVDEEGKSVLYRKGEIGDWRNHFTDTQNEMFDKCIAKRMKKIMFTFQYE